MIIKKYSNRRLYDTEASRYITLEELAERIRAGWDVQVLDAQNGEDLTQATLAQIILEGRGVSQLFSVPVLNQLIRMQDDALAEFFGRYVSWALEVFGRARQASSVFTQWTPWLGNVLGQPGPAQTGWPMWAPTPPAPQEPRAAESAEPVPPWAQPSPGQSRPAPAPGPWAQAAGHPNAQHAGSAAPPPPATAGSFAGRAEPQREAPAPAPARRDDDIAALRQELADLRARIAPKPRASSKATPRKK